MDFDDVPSSIAELDDDIVEQFLFDCLDHRFGQAKLQASDYTLTRTFPLGYRMLTSTVWIEAEVSNGGAGQYFWNRLVDYHPMTADAIDGYEKIGALAQAQAVRDCLRVFAPLESKCRAIKDEKLGKAGFLRWGELWDAQEFRGDNPLFEYEMVSAKYRVPWIRENITFFVFPIE
jgi:hypothetical protein